ncbi:nucleotide pyrophosphohydrolase [Patescibacteria group bacterium]|nr:nucleotide pyrophosphohydrolase [Patescibacteria group bacterium]MBP9710030.1 nucleotide pyrophosphohydrolase [Patescibacteria group bacterium]
MHFTDLQARALDIRKEYEAFELKKYGKKWTREQLAQGFVGDVGDLMKLVLAKSGVRSIEEADAKFAHELSDCLWSVMVLAHEYGVDLETEFLKTMDGLKNKLKTLE